MTRAERILSRNRAYLLLADLYLNGLSDRNFENVSEIPALAELLSAPFHEDHCAAEYQRLFGFNVPPYASVFLEESGYLGGVISEHVEHMYFQAGFVMSETGTMPDHVGRELLFIAYLIERQVQAAEMGHEETVACVKTSTGPFLNHLLSWLPIFAQTMQHQGNDFYALACSLTLELVLDHAGSLTEFLPALPPERPQGESSIDQTDDLRKLARFLSRPRLCGFYLSREQIAGIGRRIGVPTGFIEREQMLINVLESADRYGVLPAIFDVLQEHIESCRKFYASMLPESLAHSFDARLQFSSNCASAKMVKETLH